MKPSARFTSILVFVLTFAAVAVAQSDAGVATALASAQPGYVDKASVSLNPSQSTPLQAVTSATILNFPANANSSRAIFAAGNGGSSNGPSTSERAIVSRRSTHHKTIAATVIVVRICLPLTGSILSLLFPEPS